MSDKWHELYKEKCMTADEAAKLIENGDRISLPTANGTPRVLWQSIAKRIANDELSDCELTVGLNLNAPDLAKPEIISKVYCRDGYISPLSRPLAQKGIVDPTPFRFMDIPRTMVEDRDYNVVTMTASPMDKHGWFSAALNCSHSYSITRRRWEKGLPTKVFLEVNENAPTVYGHNHFHITEVTAIVEANWDLIALPRVEPNEKDIAIASYIAEHVPDGACVQLGIGSLPDAVGKQLVNKKDLGCHSEMIVDAYLDLYKAGALTNRKKTFMPDKSVGTIVIGSKELYEFADQNPGVEVHGIDFCANPDIIARHDNFIAINAITECDLAGQCISESIGIVPYSGIGGQADFVQGAWKSKGGKAFLAMYSTFEDKSGQMNSRISPVANGWIAISRWDVQYLATEYGCVYLKGKGMRERVKNVVSIAHPDFREKLVYEAKRLNLIESKYDIDIKKMRKEI
ncbi:Acetyl-CoA hydrolase/transferase [Syntrophomonas zehnderi OL-4]|uniref:Acetyl-CoA hydrolase/transferase n=1 Tax=Syntrophomonas zehnderi OL-4 TaxID=690567 RepID=A0A0E4GAL2_9FIRM|nr:acetyl-CoA hydrolase/transferase C-terminal domain-containing protein [Syntrophomonas zehnderi]CFX52575.1 Acetyl-CoA hydrolase/transferase [Syntrophomonas zehnderi OL-4]